MTRALLGIDLGTSAVKAIIVDASSGEVIAHGSTELVISRPHPGHAEQHPDHWWRAAGEAVRAARSQAADADILAIGLSGQMHGTVLLDASLNPLRPAVIWTDTRSAHEVADLTAKLGAVHLVTVGGSPVATGFMAATLAWVRTYEPETWARVRMILSPKDDLRRRLTGTVQTEPSDASATLLCDVQTRSWSPELLNAIGVPPEWLPPIVGSMDIAGTLLAEAAEHLGLPAGIPVVVGGADAPLAALAAGVTDDTTIGIAISSGAQVLIPQSTPRVDQRGRAHTFASPLDPKAGHPGWYAMGATMTAGLALRWLRDSVFALDGEDGFATMEAGAASTPVGAEGLLFLPYMTGERTPHMDSHARGVFLGLTPTHSRDHLTRAVIEGATFAIADAYGVLRDLGAAPERVVLAGGGTRSPLWVQVVADVLNLPVYPLAAVEGSALGAVLLAGEGIGLFDAAEQAKLWAASATEVTPIAANHLRYAKLLPIFRSAYRSLRSEFRALEDFDRS